MRSLKQLAVLGISGAVLAGGALLAGCDSGSSPDAQARAKMNEGRIAAAKGESGRDTAKQLLTQAASTPDVSTATSAQAHAVLGQVQYDAALEMLRDADRKELAASQIALQIAALGAQLGNSATLVQGYQKLDPAPAKTAIDQKIVETKGGPDKPTWIVADQLKINATSVNAADQEISRIQGEIAKRENQTKDLGMQRDAALKEADDAQKASNAAKGQESVDQFKKYSDAKKKAADLQTQIDLINGQLIPIQKDLEIAVGQQQIMQAVITELEAESKTLDDGWKDIQTKIAAQTDLIAQIASVKDAATQPSDSAAGLSIAGKATILAQTVKDAEEARTKAGEALDTSIAEFKKACEDANNAGRELSEQEQNQPALASIVDIAKRVISVSSYRLRQATAQRVLGEMQLSKASGLSARIKLRELLAPLMNQAKQTMPKELDDASLDGQLKETLAAANGSFNDTADALASIIDGPGLSTDPLFQSTKKAAAISKIFLLNNQQQLALLQGDNASADKFHASAIEAVKAAADMQVSFPTLPGDLASAIPPPPAPPAGESPASAPTTEPAASAEADSPDVQAIRATVASWAGAVGKGDMDGAKAFVQIEPGQEEFYNQYATMMSQSLQLIAAIKEKFPDQTGGMGSLDVSAQLKSIKVTVKDNDGFAPQMPGQPDKKMFTKAGDQWKLYVGPPSAVEQAMMPMMQKVGTALPSITANVKAGQYATIQDVQKAVGEAMGGAAQPAPAPTPAPQ